MLLFVFRFGFKLVEHFVDVFAYLFRSAGLALRSDRRAEGVSAEVFVVSPVDEVIHLSVGHAERRHARFDDVVHNFFLLLLKIC